jgi:hypothetical protein
MSTPVFRYYPKVRALVDLQSGKQQSAGGLPSLREDELVSRVEGAIAQLQSLEQPIARRAIGKIFWNGSAFMEGENVKFHVCPLHESGTRSRVNSL